jgi:hypothetical protein
MIVVYFRALIMKPTVFTIVSEAKEGYMAFIASNGNSSLEQSLILLQMVLQEQFHSDVSIIDAH